MAVTLWHNPRCSKSRAALQLLEDKGLEVNTRLYLQDAPDAEALREMLAALELPAAALLRKDGAALKDRPEAEIIAAMVETPALIERPVVRIGDRAVIGRPTEAIETLF
ncbi:ArsC/Spx/MgsR family protein [Pararhodobacter oceanensis]|uniref:ArsC/Spx/MgsR family protein n=1 Tax=Pararhodobacter oceanensis TaxID=2172121 RepID=UPI003A947077